MLGGGEMEKQFDLWRGLAVAAIAAGVAITAAGCQTDSNADANGGFGSGGSTTQATPASVPSGNNGTTGTQTTGYNTTGNAGKQAGNGEQSPTVDEPDPAPVNIPPPPPGYQKGPYKVVDPNCTKLDPLFRPGSMRLNASYSDGAPSPSIQDSGGWDKFLSWGAGGGGGGSGGGGGGKKPC